jgi:hypothetical protein
MDDLILSPASWAVYTVGIHARASQALHLARNSSPGKSLRAMDEALEDIAIRSRVLAQLLQQAGVDVQAALETVREATEEADDDDEPIH